MVDIEGTRGADGRAEAYDGSDDEENSGHGQRVGCHQQ